MALLFIASASHELSISYNNTLCPKPEFSLQKNQTGAFSYICWDPKENCRPVYSVRFKNLKSENNELGIFKTGLHKVVTIQDLELRLYQYTTLKVDATTKPGLIESTKTTTVSIGSSEASKMDTSPVTEEITADIRTLMRIMKKLATPDDGWSLNNIDLSNVSDVYIQNFDYREFHNGNLALIVLSKRVIASTEPGLVLQGHVTIKTADGSTLESNHVKWDIKNQRFFVNGVYVLNRNGARATGKGIYVDDQLNVLGEQHVKLEGKEKVKCLVKL